MFYGGGRFFPTLPMMPPEVSAQPAAATQPKVWRNGTLVYTAGGLIALFFFLLFGDFALSMRDRSVGPAVHWYLNHLNVPNYLFALLLTTLPAGISLILGPVVSFKSDRFRSRLGRRIPFLLVTSPMAAIGMIGLGTTPIVAKWVHGHFPNESELLVSLLCFGVFWTFYDFATIAGGAVFGGLVNDVVPKELLGRFYGLFRAISLIDGMIFNYWVMGYVPKHFTLIMIVIGIFYGVAFTWVCLKVREGEYPPPPDLPTEPGKRPGPQPFLSRLKANTVTYFRECYTNSYYLAVFLMMLVAGMTFMPVNTFGIPYATSLGIDMKTYGHSLTLTYTISLCLAYFLGWLVDIFHPLRMMMIFLAAYGLLALWGLFFAHNAQTFLAAWVAHGVISGCYFTSAASLGQRLYPQSRFAQFASACAVMGALFSMAFTPSLGLFLDFTGKVYRYTFGFAAMFAFGGLACALFVYSRFKKLGGPKNYVAPE